MDRRRAGRNGWRAAVAVLAVVAALAGPGGAALAADGDLDPSFGGDGTVTVDSFATTPAGDEGRVVALQPDGKIVAAGRNGSFNFALTRYHPDGRLDAAFGDRGRATADLGGHDFLTALSIRPDGKLLAAGYSERFPGSRVALARYNPDGGLDAAFGAGGTVAADSGRDDYVSGLNLQTDGKFVVGGYSCPPGSAPEDSPCDFLLARYDADGRPDAAFGTDGRVSTDLGGVDWALDLATQPDGKLVLVGVTRSGGRTSVALARYYSDGRLDAAIGDGGTVVSDLGGYERFFVAAAAVQPDGKIMAAVTCPACGTPVLARYHPDGRPDAAFGDGGRVNVSGGSIYDLVDRPADFRP